MSPADEVTMEEVGQSAQLRAGELIIIVVVLIMWAGETVLHPTRSTPTRPAHGLRVQWVSTVWARYR